MIKFNPETNYNAPEINHLRGLIFDALTGQILSVTYPVPLEVKDLSKVQQQDVIKYLSNCEYTVQEAIDGTLIRLWYSPEQQHWVMSTNGVEDAHSAYWMNNVSFADQMASCIPNFNFETLNKNNIYIFSICHPLNIIVINHTNPKIYHITTIDRVTLREVDCDIGVQKPRTFQLTAEEALYKTRNQIEGPVTSVGYVVVQGVDRTGLVHRYRMENVNYSRARKLRGDSNDVQYIILGHMLKQDPTDLFAFLNYYPIYQSVCDSLESELQSFIHHMYQVYGLRYKQHRYVWVPSNLHEFLVDLHENLYLKQLKQFGHTLQYENILEYMWSLPTAKVLSLIKG
jgi:hypothetical protein